MIGKNNIFNIRYSKSNNWKGQIGQTRGFVDFVSVEHCIRAILILLKNYRKKGLVTPYSIISRFAPLSENDTYSYVSFVCSILGVSFDFVLTENIHYAVLLHAMSIVENGYNGRLSSHFIMNCMDKFNFSVYD